MLSRNLKHARATSPTEPDTCHSKVDSRLALRISEVCQATGLGRTSVYAAIANGSLCARKWGRTTVILASDLQLFLECLPKISAR
jgi:excisionase family DNA binding protein